MAQNYGSLPGKKTISKTAAALQQNGIQAIIVETGADAKAKVIELLPPGAEVMNMTSATLDAIGLTQEIAESGEI